MGSSGQFFYFMSRQFPPLITNMKNTPFSFFPFYTLYRCYTCMLLSLCGVLWHQLYNTHVIENDRSMNFIHIESD